VIKQAARRSALSSVYKIGTFGVEASPPGVTIVERIGLSLVIAECAESDADSITSLSKSLGIDMPAPGQSIENDDRHVIWLAPGRWLIVGKDQTYGETAARLTATSAKIAVNDVSSSRTALRVSGPNVRDILVSSCTIDLHPSRFTAGMSASTSLVHIASIMDCINDDTFDLYVSRAYAVSFWEWLIEASEEYGGEVKAAI
jgi:heterotetrameric sarcosine oxidase gamma subunit